VYSNNDPYSPNITCSVTHGCVAKIDFVIKHTIEMAFIVAKENMSDTSDTKLTQ